VGKTDGTRVIAVAALTVLLNSLFKNPEYSDLTIKCGAREWKAHKNIVCLQVPFFAKACNGVFKV